MYKLLEDDTYAVMSYEGDESVVEVPAIYGGRPVTLLADDLFKGHSEIEEVKLPDCLKTIGGFVFDGLDKLKTVKLPNGLTDMWQYAFVRSGIEVIEIPGTVKSIIPFTFQDCKKLALVACHEGTNRIYNYAFKDCENLKMVAIYKDTEVGHDAFDGCVMLDPETKYSLSNTCQCMDCRSKRGEKKIDVMAMLLHSKQ